MAIAYLYVVETISLFCFISWMAWESISVSTLFWGKATDVDLQRINLPVAYEVLKVLPPHGDETEMRRRWQHFLASQIRPVNLCSADVAMLISSQYYPGYVRWQHFTWIKFKWQLSDQTIVLQSYADEWQSVKQE